MKFVEMFGKVFDCLNVSRLNQHLKGKSEPRQYTDVNDWKFEVSFLSFLIQLKACNLVKKS